MKKQEYESYQAYVDWQKSKIDKPGVVENLTKVRARRIKEFRNLFREFSFGSLHAKALCLGARLGEEVEALSLLGFDAIGVDLNEYPPLVIAGDFNKTLPFSDHSFSLIFSNSVDHVYDLQAWSKEIRRLLLPRGQLFLWLMLGFMGNYESIQIDKPEEITDLFPDFNILVNKPISWKVYNHALLLEKSDQKSEQHSAV